MQYLLSKASHSILVRLANEQTLCAFDFDGTLAPIVGHPDKARLRPHTRALLGDLALLYPCVILSGRAREDLLQKLAGVRLKHIIGNHGAETGGTAKQANPEIKTWKTAIEPLVSALPGLWIEDKGLSLAVHYRQSPQKSEARRRIFEATENLKDARVYGGKQVVNLVVAGAPNKGTALASERTRWKAGWVLYVGDDENDEDAFALGGNLISVRIGRKRHTHARFYLRTQAEIDTLLEQLVELREAKKAGGE